jgi:hypothetical protein
VNRYFSSVWQGNEGEKSFIAADEGRSLEW